MAERATSLVDEVLPPVPVRQWVLTLPYRLRYRLAWDHALCRAVLGVYARVLLAFYARTARAHGIQDGQTGMVTVIQRFGRGLQLNVPLHTLVLDGVFSETRSGQLAFHPAAPPNDEGVAHVLATVRTRVGRLLIRRQLEPEDDNAPAAPLTEASPVLAGLAGASVQPGDSRQPLRLVLRAAVRPRHGDQPAEPRAARSPVGGRADELLPQPPAPLGRRELTAGDRPRYPGRPARGLTSARASARAGIASRCPG